MANVLIEYVIKMADAEPIIPIYGINRILKTIEINKFIITK